LNAASCHDAAFLLLLRLSAMHYHPQEKPLSPSFLSLALLLAMPTYPAHAQTSTQTVSEDTCLLQTLKTAPAEQTVAEILKHCSTVQLATAAIPATAPVGDLDTAIARIKTEAASLERSPFNDRMQSELRALGEPFALLPHRPNYLLPISYHHRDPSSAANAGAYKNTEAQFQMSFKIPITQPLWNNQLIPFFAYTGRAWWQVYDSERSRPFREYNHEPEILIAAPISGVQALGWKLRLGTLGFNHQSNGRSEPQSRSWNRIVGEFYADRGTSAWSSLKIWHRLSESSKTSPTDSNGDDNPDITRYMGNFEFKLGWIQPQSHQLTLTTRKSFSSGGKGALQLDWSHPIKASPALRWYAQGFSGYGDSLIDYNQKINRFGLGIMINDWF
jgi:phospholipase A1/A2